VLLALDRAEVSHVCGELLSPATNSNSPHTPYGGALGIDLQDLAAYSTDERPVFLMVKWGP